MKVSIFVLFHKIKKYRKIKVCKNVYTKIKNQLIVINRLIKYSKSITLFR